MDCNDVMTYSSVVTTYSTDFRDRREERREKRGVFSEFGQFFFCIAENRDKTFTVFVIKSRF